MSSISTDLDFRDSHAKLAALDSKIAALASSLA
jgi:hypothetical protein